MGNNLPHELKTEDMANYSRNLETDDIRLNDSTTKRKTSASVDQIRDLYLALQELVPSQGRPKSTTAKKAISEDTSRGRIGRARLSNKADKCDVVSSISTVSPVPFNKRHRCSSPLPTRSQPKIVQRNRSYSCVTLSASSNSLIPPGRDFLAVPNERGCTNSPTKSQRMNEEFCNLIESFTDKKFEKTSPTTEAKHEIEDASTKRRLSGGDNLDRRRERLKDPKSKIRRRSIGGSLLLNAIIKSTAANSNRQDSLTNALSIVTHKDELQEILTNCLQEKSEEKENDSESGVDSFDDIDGKPKQEVVDKHIDVLMSSINEPKRSNRNVFSEQEQTCSDIKTQAVVGTEMHNLLEALQELVVSGEGTPALTPPTSSQNSRRTSWIEKNSARRESLDELELYFKNRLDEISERENEEITSKSGQNKTNDKTATFKNRIAKDGAKNGVRRSSSAEQYTEAGTIHSSVIHRSQSSVELVNSNYTSKVRPARARRASSQIEEKRKFTRGRSNSSFEIVPHPDTPVHEIKNSSKSDTSSRRSRRRKSDIPIIGQEEVLTMDSPVGDEVRSRALWKKDQEMFAEQVNQRLQDWLERATALTRLKAKKLDTDDSTSHLSVDTNPDSSREEDVKTKRSKFAMKKAFVGRVKRSKSLHNILDPEEIQVEKQKSKSPLLERSKYNLLSRLRIPRSKSMHNVTAMKPKLENIEATESDESLNYSPPSLKNRCSMIWYDDESDSPELIPKVDAINLSGESPRINKVYQRRKSCPTAQDNYLNVDCVQSKSHINSKRISRLPIDLPLFFIPGMPDAASPRIQKTDENCRQNSSDKENKMPRVRKGLFPIKQDMKKELFYKESSIETQLNPKPVSQETINHSNSQVTKPASSTLMDSERFVLYQDKLTVSPDFENFCDFRDRAKSTESEDSGCPNTSDC